jgi:filamentous hemagglutinin family protein
MNKAYRLVWNRAKEIWVVVAETVRGKGGIPSVTITAAASLILSAASTHALPTSPHIVNGTAAISTSGNAMTVTNSANAIINWQSFSIGQNESTRFVQPTASSAVLNRVTGGDPSKILGTLQSNGKILLINQNGILFGTNARVDVNGLIASTLDITNQDFLAGKMNFTAGSIAGSVENQGTITTPGGGQVYLIAPDVTNSGIITSPNGDILLAAGKEVLIVDKTNPEIAMVVSAPENQSINLGTLVADAGKIGLYGGIVKQSGRVSADSAVSEGGKIFFRSTRQTVLDPESNISADGIDKADGGKVIVWSDGDTQAAGAISARAGSEGGNGGFIETSGKTIDFSGVKVDASATKGSAGLWLIDPNDLTIDAAGAASLASALDTGVSGTSTTVTQDSGAYGVLNGSGIGYLTVNSPISWTKPSTLSLSSTSNMFINAAITGTGVGGGVTAISGLDINIDAAITTNSGAISLTAGDGGNKGNIVTSAIGSLSTTGSGGTGANISMNSGGIFGFSDISTSGVISAGVGDVSFVPGDGNTSIAGLTSGRNLTIYGATVTNVDSVIASGNIDIIASQFSHTGGGALLRSTGFSGILSIQAYNSIDLTGPNFIEATGASGAVKIKTDNIAGMAGTPTIRATGPNGIVSLEPYTAGRTISVDGSRNLANLSILNAETPYFTAAGAVKLITGGPITFNAAANFGTNNLSLSAAGAVTQTSQITAAGLELLGTGSYNLPNTGNNISTLAGNATGNISVTNGAIADITIGTVNATSGLTSGGAITVNSENGNIVVSNASAGVDLNAGNAVNLSANGIGGVVSLAAGAAVTAGGGVTLSTALQGGNITTGIGSSVTAISGNIVLDSQNASSSVVTAGNYSASAGNITLTSNSTLDLRGGTFTCGPSNTVTFKSTLGGITQTVAPVTVGPVGSALQLTPAVTATISMGDSGNSILSNVNASENAGLTLKSDSNGLKIDGVTTASPGSVDLASAGNITLLGDINESNSVGSVTLNALGGSSILTTAGAEIFSNNINLMTAAGASGGIGTALNPIMTAPMLGIGTSVFNIGQSAAGAPSSVYISNTDNATISAVNLAVNAAFVFHTFLGLAVNAGINTGTQDMTLISDTGALALAGSLSGNNIFLKSSTTISQTAGVVTASNLAFNAGGTVGLNNYNLIGTVAGSSSTGTISITNDKSLIIGTLSGSGYSETGLKSTATGVGSVTLNLTNTNIVNSRITDGVASGPAIVTPSLNISTYGGIASSIAPLETQVSTLSSGRSGDLYIKNTGALTTSAAALVQSAGTVSLMSDSSLSIGAGGVNAGSGVELGSTGNLNIGGAVSSSSPGSNIILHTSGNFINSSSLTPGSGGSWKVWSADPSLDTRGGLLYDFKQYNATYGTTTVLGSGNGFLYSLAPTVTAGLTGTVSKVYDGTTAATLTAANYTAPSGSIDGDTVLINKPTSGVFDTKNVGSGKSVTVTGITVASATNGAAQVYGYKTANATGAIGSISQAGLAITADNAVKTYGQTTTFAGTEFTSSGLKNGETIGSVTLASAGAAATASVNGSPYSITASNATGGSFSPANYSITYNPGLLTINPAALTVTGILTGTTSKVYDGSNIALLTPDNYLLSGFVNGDGASVTKTEGVFDSANAGINKNVTVSLTDSDFSATGNTVLSNYTLPGSISGTIGTISKAPLIVSAIGSNKIYDGNTIATINLIDNRIAGDLLTLSNTDANFIDKNVGTGKTINVTGISVTGASADNYTFNATTATTADISAKTLTVSATGNNKIYAGNTIATVNLVDDRVSGDLLTLSNTGANFIDKNVGSGKTVNISGINISGANAGNYIFNTTAVTTADISAKNLTVSAIGNSKVYDGNTAATISLTDNRIAGDDLALSSRAANFTDKNVGTGKTVNVAGINVTGVDAGNYIFNTTAVTTADISAKNLTVTATANNKIYDGNTIATISLTDNRIAGDDLALSSRAANFTDKNVGTGKTVNIAGINIGGGDAGNYTFNTTVTATADISPKALTVSATADNKMYDGTTTASVNLFDNRVSGDILIPSNRDANFADNNVGTAKTVSITGIDITGIDAGNYTFNRTAETTADITVNPLFTVGSNSELVNGVLSTENSPVAPFGLVFLTSAPPSLETCIADPNVPGCAEVLPSLATCTADPRISGCSVVLANRHSPSGDNNGNSAPKNYCNP